MPQPLPGIQHIVAVGSGKGGVGKSTVSANLACELARRGLRVGLLDADIYGPSIPILMGLRHRQPETVETPQGPRMRPLTAHGVRVMSMGLLAAEEQPLIWRGPMAHSALQQCLFQTEWGELDYLIVDLPPGTGDIHLTLAQSLAVAGVAIVSTPQDVGLTISKKTLFMFQNTKVPILGLIENMSFYRCPHCGQRDDIFGSGAVAPEAGRLGLEVLGQIPIVRAIRESCDRGAPIVVADERSEPAACYRGIADRVVARVSGGAGATEPTDLKSVQEATGPTIILTFGDGHQARYRAADLRRACPCASCVDEFTGKRTLDSASISDSLWVISSERVGHYALQFQFGDGHGTGIYSFAYLRELAAVLAETYCS